MVTTKFSFFHVLVIALSLLLGGVAIAVQGRDRNAYKFIDTGLVQNDNYPSKGIWINDDNVIINTFERDAHTNKTSENAFLYNVNSGKNILLLANGRVDNFSDRNWTACVFSNGGGKKVNLGSKLEFFSFRAGMEHECFFEKTLNDERAIVDLRPSDGYLDLGKKLGGFPKEKARYVLADGTSIDLPLRGGAVSGVFFIYFINKYFLNERDYRRFAGESEAPFYLMSPSGEISEIPYPRDFVEKVLHGELLNYITPMRHGLFVSSTGSSAKGERGLFLVRDSQYIHLWGGRTTFAANFSLSPSGCKVAFLGFDRRLFARSDETVKIIDICQGDKK